MYLNSLCLNKNVIKLVIYLQVCILAKSNILLWYKSLELRTIGYVNLTLI